MLFRAARCPVAVLVAAATCFFLVHPETLADESASLRGRVLSPGTAAPRAGVVVVLVDASSAASTYRSAPTNDQGVFRLEGAPAGTYRVLVETPEGAFLAGEPVALKAGANPPVSLALKAETPPAGGGQKGGPSGWQKWVIVGAIVVGAFFVADALTQEEKASPF